MSMAEIHAGMLAQERNRQNDRRERRFEAAKAALMGLLAYSPAAGGVQVTPQTAALIAVEYADALCAALDGTEG